MNQVELFCTDDAALELLIQKMFRLARDELIETTNVCDFQDTASAIPATDRDMGFYRFNFGLSTVDRREDDRHHTPSTNTLVYYRIWKNANDNIRRIMYRYGKSTDFIDDGMIIFMVII